MLNTNMTGQWYNTQVGKEITSKKYFHEGETFHDFANRVASIFQDKLLGHDVKTAIYNADFFPAGRSLYGAGSKGKFKASMSNCFTAGHKVITKRGLINIEDVAVGDEVITDNGSWQPINAVMKRIYEGDLYEIETDTLEKITCTPNHRFLTQDGWVRADRLLANSAYVRKSHRLRIPDVEPSKRHYGTVELERYLVGLDGYETFTRDGKLGYKVRYPEGHYATQGNLINPSFEHDSEMSYFIGRWLGDGSVTTRPGKAVPSIVQLVFNTTTEQVPYERCLTIARRAFGIEPSVRVTEQNTTAMRIENPFIASWILDEFGARCDGKKVPPKYSGDFDMALGLIDSDGCVLTHGAIVMTLKNLNLINWLRDTLYVNGIPCTRATPVERQDKTWKFSVFAGVARQKLHGLLTRDYHDKRIGKDTVSELDGKYVKLNSINIIENCSTTVYNLSVENIHSYTVNGIVCHNCYIMPMPEDNIESIFDVAKETARIFSMGGGAGINISKLRPNGAKVSNAAKTSTGACSFMEIFDAVGGVIGANNRRK